MAHVSGTHASLVPASAAASSGVVPASKPGCGMAGTNVLKCVVSAATWVASLIVVGSGV
ncbi:MAG: hypothetical protein U0235_22955 [Polyangiaceae bacterium]